MLERSRLSSTLIVAFVSAGMATSGCVMKGRNKSAAYVADAALIVLGASVISSRPDTNCPLAEGCSAPEPILGTRVLAGATLLALGIVGGTLQIARDVRPEGQVFEPDLEVEHHYDDNSVNVYLLAANARASAREGACQDVKDLARQVWALDVIYYQNYFKQDPDIALCLG
jgi:hypothetical protein